MNVKLLFVILSAAVAGHVLAQDSVATKTTQDKDRTKWEAAFKKADLDKSGGLSEAELGKTKTNQFQGIKKNFSKVDANKDGQVTMEERDALIAKNQARK